MQAAITRVSSVGRRLQDRANKFLTRLRNRWPPVHASPTVQQGAQSGLICADCSVEKPKLQGMAACAASSSLCRPDKHAHDWVFLNAYKSIVLFISVGCATELASDCNLLQGRMQVDTGCPESFHPRHSPSGRMGSV